MGEECDFVFSLGRDPRSVGWGSVPQEISWGHLPDRKEHNCRQAKMVCWDPYEGPLDQWVVEQILSGSHQADKFANFSANEISGVTHRHWEQTRLGRNPFSSHREREFGTDGCAGTENQVSLQSSCFKQEEKVYSFNLILLYTSCTLIIEQETLTFCIL